MNTRIRELAEHAGFVLWGDEEWNPGDTVDWSSRYDAELEKFAELIVRECLSNMEGGDLDFAIWKTKKDFGVEE